MGPRKAAARVPAAVAVVCAALFAVLFTAATLVMAVRHGAPLPPERTAHDWSTAHVREPLRSLARALTATGTGPIPYLMAVLAGLLAGAQVLGRIRAAACAVAVLAAGQAIRYGLMELLDRPRPQVADWAGHATGHAWPSGHATTAVLAAGILAWGIGHRARPDVAHTWYAVLALWAVGVGATRVLLGVHWPGDVLAGWLLGLTVLALASLAEPFALRHRAPPLPPKTPAEQAD